ncbi:MAG: hypothetical protein IT234_02620, partial [Bacteroidia bacterium]|nr:hypothetical protein [Bacteroidia bacterium]
MKQVLFYFFFISVSLSAQTWYTMGIGVQKNILLEPCVVSGIINYEDSIVIAGNFKKSGTTILNGTAKWDGNNWQKMGIGTWIGNGATADSTGNGGFGLCSYNNNLIVAGSFLGAGGAYINDSNHLANGIAKWNGSDWEPLTQTGDGLN